MKNILPSLFMFLFSSLCFAQPIPSDKDLQAAYCFKMNRILISQIEPLQLKMESEIDKYKNDEYMMNFIKEQRQSLNSKKRDASRLLKYIDAKTNGNYGNLLGATSQAEEDLNSRTICSNRCFMSLTDNDIKKGKEYTGKKITNCDTQCDIEHGSPMKRIKRCNDLSWLPF